MKKLLFALPLIALLGACAEEAEPLTPPSAETKTVKLVKSNCGLTGDDSVEAFDVSLDIEGKEEKYTLEIGPNCYAHSTYDEFLIKKDGYIKSKSQYTVDRLIIDFVNKKGVNFIVENASGEAVESHASTVQTEFPGENDYGYVLEYPIDGNAWKIKNTTDFKPAFYSVTVVFSL